ncbi:MAG: ABC transporter permease [Vicinamibacterales bacterium]
MAFWTKVFRAFTSIAPRFKREYGDEAARDYARLVAREDHRRGRAASLWLALRGSIDALRVAMRERFADLSLIPLRVGPDARQALRIYRREPLLALAVTATLAVAAGPTTAIYAVVHDVMLASLPYERPERIVVIWAVTAGEVRDYRQVPAFAQTSGMRWHRVFMNIGGEGVEVPAVRVTSNFFSTLGLPILEGHGWDPNDEEAVIVTRAFADRHFGRGVPAVGRVLTFDGVPRAITGVVPARPVLQRPGYHVFVPYRDAEQVGAAPYGSNAAFLVARLRDGVSVEEAHAQAHAFALNNPNLPEQRRTGYRSDLMTFEASVRKSLAILWILPLPAIAVFLIALLSLGGLLLARAARNSAEIAVRLALGATRMRLARLAAFEALALAVPGVLLGVALAIVLLRVARASIPPQILPVESTAPGAALAVGAIGALLLATAVFATAPVVTGRFRRRVIDLRSSAQAVAGMKRARSQAFLVVSQVALSVTLVAAGIWMSASIGRLLSQPTGYNSRDLVVVQTTLPAHLYKSRDARQAFVRTALERLAAIPSVERAAITNAVPGTPISGNYGAARMRPDQPLSRNGISISRNDVSPDYFRVMGIPLVAGRYFAADDESSGGRVVILGEGAARQFFPEGALGQLVSFSRDDRRRVVGIVRDVHANMVGQPSRPQVYLPLGDPEWTTPTRFVLRTRDEEGSAWQAVAAIREIDPLVPAQAYPIGVAMGIRLTPTRLISRLVMVLSGFALLLAIINIYALAAFGVAQRRRELGLCIALGADRRHAVNLAMRRSLFWSLLGLVIGVAAAIGIVRPSLQSAVQHFAADMQLLLAAAVAVGVTAIVASWIPARRAALIDPATTLKAE